MNNISKRLLLAFATVEVVFIGILVGYTILSNKTIEERKLVQINKPTPLPTQESSDLGLSYANTEIDLINKKYAHKGNVSFVFAFELLPFHKDWACFSAGYSNRGYQITCQQKSCSLEQSFLWPPTPLSADEQKICSVKYLQREYPRSLSSLYIQATEIEAKDKIQDSTSLMKQENTHKTPKGTAYEFDILSEQEYSNTYIATFYSPFELTERLSKLTGTFSGADWIYGKYTITTHVTGLNIENKVQTLFEKIIDSTVFVQPDVER